VERGKLSGNIKMMAQEITKLERAAPHRQDDKRIVQGMLKEGNQSYLYYREPQGCIQ